MAELQGLITPSLGQFRVTLVGKRVQFWLRWSSGSVEAPGIDRLTFWNCIPGRMHMTLALILSFCCWLNYENGPYVFGLIAQRKAMTLS